MNLAANKKENDERKYTRFTVDIENYREKREKTLRALANRMAEKVKKTGRSISLEPMNAYERRIIHSEVQLIEGVTTNSVGQEGNRRVIIYIEGTAKPTEAKAPRAGTRSNDRRRGGKKGDRRSGAPKEKRSDSAERPVYKRPDTPRPQPRKIEKAKDLDSYFAKLREFGSTIQ